VSEQRGETREQTERDLRAWEHDLARHWGLPADFLGQGKIAHHPSEANQAAWSEGGGIVSCADEELATTIAAVIQAYAADDYLGLDAKLRDALRERLLRASSRIDVSLYWRGLAGSRVGSVRHPVELLAPSAEGLPDLPEAVEHVFAIRDEMTVVSWASNIPSLRVDDHWLHSVGVGTHPDYRRRGFGTSVVAALLDHVATEDGAALWVGEARNVASLRMARSLGFAPHFCVLHWRPGEEADSF